MCSSHFQQNLDYIYEGVFIIVNENQQSVIVVIIVTKINLIYSIPVIVYVTVGRKRRFALRCAEQNSGEDAERKVWRQSSGERDNWQVQTDSSK